MIPKVFMFYRGLMDTLLGVFKTDMDPQITEALKEATILLDNKLPPNATFFVGVAMEKNGKVETLYTSCTEKALYTMELLNHFHSVVREVAKQQTLDSNKEKN